MTKREFYRRLSHDALREAERYALARASCRYVPFRNESDLERQVRNLDLKLCCHGKIPRLDAEGLSRLCGFHVQGCKKCP